MERENIHAGPLSKNARFSVCGTTPFPPQPQGLCTTADQLPTLLTRHLYPRIRPKWPFQPKLNFTPLQHVKSIPHTERRINSTTPQPRPPQPSHRSLPSGLQLVLHAEQCILRRMLRDQRCMQPRQQRRHRLLPARQLLHRHHNAQHCARRHSNSQRQRAQHHRQRLIRRQRLLQLPIPR